MLPALPSCYWAGNQMAIQFAAFMVLALVLGFKHSYDADHLVAVSNLITRSGSVRKTSLMSVAWAAGHMVTAAIITVLLYTFRQTLLTEFLAHLDLLVAVMVLGVATLGGILVGVAVFSLGVVAGMIVFAVSLNYPMLRWGQGPVRRVVNTAVAVLSILYAALLFAGFGGFNPLPSPL